MNNENDNTKRIEPIFEPQPKLSPYWIYFKDGLHEIVGYARLAKQEMQPRKVIKEVKIMENQIEIITEDNEFDMFEISQDSFGLEMDGTFLTSEFELI